MMSELIEIICITLYVAVCCLLISGRMSLLNQNKEDERTEN